MRFEWPCVSQPVSTLDGTGEGERKRTADRELSFSDAHAVYIDGAGWGEAVVSGRSASGLAHPA